MTEDFGEHLVAIREQLEVALPIRVPFWRLLAAAGLESFSATAIQLFRRDWRSCAQDRYGLPPPEQDLNVVLEKFRQLNGNRATREQVEQAEDAFKKQLQRRFERGKREIDLWITAVHRGLFIGSVLTGLMLVSMMMCLATGRFFAVQVIFVSSLISQLLGAFVCLQGWHRS